MDVCELARRLYDRIDPDSQRDLANLMHEDASSAAIGLLFDAIEGKSLQPDELAAAIELAHAGKFRKSSAYLLELLTEYHPIRRQDATVSAQDHGTVAGPPSILDVQVARGATPQLVAEVLARSLGVAITEDRYGNPLLALDSGVIVVARSCWDRRVVYAEVRSGRGSDALANRAYEALVDATEWDVSLVDSTDNNPEDVVLRHRSRDV